MRVSVIIPCYNCSGFVCETLASLEKQQRLPDEVICVNDGSSDDTERVIADFAENSMYPIRLITQENSGVSVARNTGIEEAKGDVLFFLDADDKIAPCFIKEAEQAMQDGYDTVYGWFTHRDDELLPIDHIPQRREVEKKTAMQDFMYRKDRCHTGAFAYRRALLEEGGLRFTQGARYGEDWEFTTKYLDHCYRVLRLEESMMFYRLSDTSAMKKITYAHTDAISAAERVERYLLSRNSDCYQLFCGYMKHRAIFSIANTFAKFRQIDLFRRFCREYPVKKSMRIVAKCPQVRTGVRLAAGVFGLSARVFYWVAGSRFLK